MTSYLVLFLVLSPLPALLLLLMPFKLRDYRGIASLGTVPGLILSLVLYQLYMRDGSLEAYSFRADWLRFGNLAEFDKRIFTVDFELALDGLSLAMVLLTAILSLIAAWSSRIIKRDHKLYFICFFLLEAGMFGLFSAQNLVLFFLFFEMTLVAAFFLIGKWGFAGKERAAYYFLVYNGAGSAILLIVILVLFARTGTTDIESLRHIMTVGGVALVAPISGAMKSALLLALLAAFAIQLPVFPLHSWMVRVHAEAPAPVVILHAGVLLKIGAYGMIRFGMGIFPEQFAEWGSLLAVLGVISFLYGAFLALVQTEFKRVLAYSSVSHMGVVLMGLGSLEAAGVKGAAIQAVSHGLIAGLLFLLVGFLQEKKGTTVISELGGLAKGLPVFSGFLLAGGLAALGLPGMSGFIGEFLAFTGLFTVHPYWAAIALPGLVLTAVYVLRAVLGITYGSPGAVRAADDLDGEERFYSLLLLVLIIGIGIYPELAGGLFEEALDGIMAGMGR